MSEREKTREPNIWRYQTKAGTRYRVVVEGEKDPVSGKRVQRVRSSIRTMEEAKKVRAELVNEAARGPDWTVEELAERWLVDLERTGRVKPTTVMKYERRLCNHVLPGLGKEKVREVSVLRLQALFDAKARAMSASSLLTLHQPVRGMFGRAVLWGLIPVNPAVGVSLPARPPSPGRAWSIEEVRAFLARTRSDDLYPIGRLLLLTGARIGELVTLRWEDVDLDAGVITIARTLTRSRTNQRVPGDGPKSRAGRRAILLTAGCVAALRRQRRRNEERAASDPAWSDEGWVFPGRHGRCWNEQTTRAWFERRMGEIGLPRLRLHDGRHTHATIGRKLGVSADIMAARLGHRVPGMTAVYTHLDAEAQRPLVDALERALRESGDRTVTARRRTSGRVKRNVQRRRRKSR